jgi:hypothetical protein
MKTSRKRFIPALAALLGVAMIGGGAMIFGLNRARAVALLGGA